MNSRYTLTYLWVNPPRVARSGENKPGDKDLREHRLLQASMSSSSFEFQVRGHWGLNYEEKLSYQLWQGKAWVIDYSRQGNWAQFKQKGGLQKKTPLQAEIGFLGSPSLSGGYGK